MFRWTIKELQEYSDLEIIRGVLVERQETLTNMYSTLSKKLKELYSKVDIKIKKGRKNI